MMAKIFISEDCGNSPKNLFVQTVSIALAVSDAPTLLGSVTEDIRWNLVGHKLVEGKDALAEALAQIEDGRLLELAIQHVVTHGKAGAVNGVAKLKDGKTRAFCDVYEFSGVKGTTVKEITSYWITTT